MELVVPALNHQAAFTRFYDDFVQFDPDNADYYRSGKDDFPTYVTRLTDESLGKNLRKGYVPCSHFWLLDAEQQIIGAIRIRHHINTPFLTQEAGHIGYDIAPSYRGRGCGKQMLALALPKARELGITRALITANEDNMASRQVIEANGGTLENIINGEVFNESLARYWVDING